MKYLLVTLSMIALAACTTERNPDVCCTTDADCARLGVDPIGCRDGFVCTNFMCVAAACSAATDCTAAAPVCEPMTATCTACATSRDCDGYADSPVCDVVGACRGCRLDAECPSDVCDADTGRCASEADVLYASPTGIDAAACTRANPCSTTRAIVVASADPAPSIVRLLPGTYGAPIVVSSGVTTIYGSGVKLAPPIGATYAVEVRDSANLEIRGIEIVRGGGGLNAALCMGSGALVPVLTLRESASDSIVNVLHGKVKLRRSILTNNTPVSINDDSTFEADQSRFGTPSSFNLLRTFGARMTVRITNSIFEKCTIAMSNSDLVPDKSEYYLAFNTFVLDTLSNEQDCTNTSNHPRVAIFENNIFYATNLSAVILGTTCTLAGNITHPQSPGLGGTNVDVDPLFVNFAAGDYRLQPESPAIDRAIPSSGPNLDHDFVGTPRPQAAQRDVGAFEFVP